MPDELEIIAEMAAVERGYNELVAEQKLIEARLDKLKDGQNRELTAIRKIVARLKQKTLVLELRQLAIRVKRQKLAR